VSNFVDVSIHNAPAQLKSIAKIMIRKLNNIIQKSNKNIKVHFSRCFF